jgi:hypothetical protein
MFVPPRVDQLAASAGLSNHRTVGAQGIGGSRVIQHWELNGGDNRARAVLTSGEVDVFTMACHIVIPDPGIDNLVELGLKNNPKLRLFVQASWMPFDTVSPEKRLRDNATRDETDLDALQTATDVWRGKLEAQIDELNKRHEQTSVFIVPVGDAVNEVRRQIKAKKFPGLDNQVILFRDPIGHGQGHVMALAAYCNFAAIYGRTPVGLKLEERGVNDEQHAVLQRIAWETVSKYSHSGVKK